MSSGGSSTPTSTTTTSNSLPAYAQPYMENLLGQGAALTDINQNPYQSYPGQQVANQTDLTQQANAGIAGMGVAPQTGAATTATQNAIGQAQNFGYQGPAFQNMGLNSLNIQAPNLQNYQMQQPADVTTGQFTDAGQAAQYMNPYFQNVVDYQSQEAARQAQIQQNQIKAQATAAGAYGGSRGALMESELGRNLATQQQGIAATGAQNAYQAAQQAYQADQARALQAAQGNQQIGYQTGAQNLAANLGVQSLGSGQNLQAQQLNQAAGLTAQQQGLTQNLAANQQNLTNAQNTAQYGLQGLNAQLQGAQQLGTLGSQQNQQQLAINQQLAQAGAAKQATDQSQLTAQYQDFQNNLNYPYKQLDFMKNLIGQPASNKTDSVYQAAPDLMSTLSSLGITAAGIASLLKVKKGGEIKVPKRMAVGGLAQLEAAARGQPNPYLQASLQGQNSVPPQIAGNELQTRGQLTTAALGQAGAQPISAMSPQMPSQLTPPPQNPVDKGLGQLQAPNMGGFADGGIVGYAPGGSVGPYNDPDVYWDPATEMWRSLKNSVTGTGKAIQGAAGTARDWLREPMFETPPIFGSRRVSDVQKQSRAADALDAINRAEQAVPPKPVSPKPMPIDSVLAAQDAAFSTPGGMGGTTAGRAGVIERKILELEARGDAESMQQAAMLRKSLEIGNSVANDPAPTGAASLAGASSTSSSGLGSLKSGVPTNYKRLTDAEILAGIPNVSYGKPDSLMNWYKQAHEPVEKEMTGIGSIIEQMKRSKADRESDRNLALSQGLFATAAELVKPGQPRGLAGLLGGLGRGAEKGIPLLAAVRKTDREADLEQLKAQAGLATTRAGMAQRDIGTAAQLYAGERAEIMKKAELEAITSARRTEARLKSQGMNDEMVAKFAAIEAQKVMHGADQRLKFMLAGPQMAKDLAQAEWYVSRPEQAAELARLKADAKATHDWQQLRVAVRKGVMSTLKLNPMEPITDPNIKAEVDRLTEREMRNMPGYDQFGGGAPAPSRQFAQPGGETVRDFTTQ